MWLLVTADVQAPLGRVRGALRPRGNASRPFESVGLAVQDLEGRVRWVPHRMRYDVGINDGLDPSRLPVVLQQRDELVVVDASGQRREVYSHEGMEVLVPGPFLVEADVAWGEVVQLALVFGDACLLDVHPPPR